MIEEINYLLIALSGIFVFLWFDYAGGIIFGLVMSIFIFLLITYMSLIERNRRDKK